MSAEGIAMRVHPRNAKSPRHRGSARTRNQQQAEDTASQDRMGLEFLPPARRRAPFPDRPQRAFAGWPEGLACYLDTAPGTPAAEARLWGAGRGGAA